MGRRRSSSIAGSPLLIGAITTLIVVVAVFLSYNANNGLPFVPTYDIKVELPEASSLQKSNQVRLGGTRIGTISNLQPKENPRTGALTAVATLKLEKKVEELPVDTRAIVQSVSPIGLKYLELKKGISPRGIKPGGTIPVANTTEPVGIEELFNMFQKPTREAIKINTNNFGDGLAGRGLGLNATIAELRPLVYNAVPVLNNLASPQTDLHGFWVALNRVASQMAPVAEQNALYYVYLDTFFKSFATVTRELEEATVGGPPALEQAIKSLPVQAVFLEHATEFMHLLKPSAAALVTVAPPLAHAFSTGATTFSEAAELNPYLASSSVALAEFAHNPVATLGLENFTEALEIGNPLLAGITPLQTYCNYITLAFRNLASASTQNVGIGTMTRAGFVLASTGPNNEGYPASAPANGPSEEHPGGRPGPGVDTGSNHLHANPYPYTAGPGQRKVCEAGNEFYIPKQLVTSNLPANDVSNNREFTSREDNLYGEKYPASTLKALGITGGKGKS